METGLPQTILPVTKDAEPEFSSPTTSVHALRNHAPGPLSQLPEEAIQQCTHDVASEMAKQADTNSVAADILDTYVESADLHK